jgi:hypothetical protein
VSNQLRQDYGHAYKVWLGEQKQAPLNAGAEPAVPTGMTPDEAKRIREAAAAELGV